MTRKDEIKQMLNANDNMLKDVQDKYWRIKKIFTVVLDPDRKDELATTMRQAMDSETAMILQQFVEDCEDLGIHLLQRRLN